MEVQGGATSWMLTWVTVRAMDENSASDGVEQSWAVEPWCAEDQHCLTGTAADGGSGVQLYVLYIYELI